MPVKIKVVQNHRDLRKFISLPAKIHQNHPLWIPPIYMDERRFFNPRKNRAFTYSDTLLLLAYEDNKAVGRIMGIINRRYNEFRKEKHARFGFLECRENQGVAHRLLSRVEQWALGRGMDKIVGPLGFSDQDPEGYLVEGFEHEPTISTYYNFAYFNELLEKEGYLKEKDYVVYRVDLPDKIPDFYAKIYRRAVKKGTYRLIEFWKRKQLKPYIKSIFRVMNECFQDFYGFHPLEEEEMEDLARRYLPILDPRFIKIVAVDDEVIGFNIAMPNLSEGIRRSRGRLFPFGVIKIWRSAKKTKQLDSLIGGIKKEHRGRGVDVMMGYKTIESALRAGFKFVDSHHELEDNYKVRAEMERLGGQVYKRFRIYQKQIRNKTKVEKEA